jgi:cell division protein FtsX
MSKKFFKICLILLIVVTSVVLVYLNIKKSIEIKQEKYTALQKINEVKEIFEKYCKIQIFLSGEFDDSRLDEIKNRINNIDNIKFEKYISKAEALEIMREKFNSETTKSVLDEYNEENNIFPASITVLIKFNEQVNEIDDKLFNDIESQLSNIEGVIEVKIGNKFFLDIYKQSGLSGLKKIIKEYERIADKLD